MCLATISKFFWHHFKEVWWSIMNTKKRKHVRYKTATICNWKLFLSQKPHLNVNYIHYLFHLVIEHDLDTIFHRHTASLNKLHTK